MAHQVDYSRYSESTYYIPVGSAGSLTGLNGTAKSLFVPDGANCIHMQARSGNVWYNIGFEATTNFTFLTANGEVKELLLRPGTEISFISQNSSHNVRYQFFTKVTNVN